jgi:hypothetical protein
LSAYDFPLGFFSSDSFRRDFDLNHLHDDDDDVDTIIEQTILRHCREIGIGHILGFQQGQQGGIFLLSNVWPQQ